MPKPPFVRIADELAARIDAGELRAGDRVPSTREITQTWGVAMATATKALARLRERGLVHPQPGRGTLVTARESGLSPHRVARPSTPPKQDVTAERIIRLAIEIADADGLSGLSMRRIATELGVPTMSLYRHLAGKDALLGGMYDTVFRDAPLPEPPPQGWRACLELAGRAEWSLYRRHPWLATAVSLTRPQPTPHAMLHTEWVLRALDGLGLDGQTMLHVAVTMHGFSAGLAVNVEIENAAVRDTGQSAEQWLEARNTVFDDILRRYPMPMLTSITAAPELSVTLDDLFEFGLARLLDGFAALLPPTP
ncbi:TetR/AcrR family transcriptional regulator C-terminal domain-containing protein [Pseudonocardia acaciae]|uniref:TetR/AcrR family transcriptional regulator C-terminal domain-containing protein n=1 Tax=Pseudonocardia acaciae TaxID=551276 RepID=UPI00048EA627|nr:TetR/AcrR family transcriptional regulator C-terminal domain-containing protein [Pseudonocardia acaciae]